MFCKSDSYACTSRESSNFMLLCEVGNLLSVLKVIVFSLLDGLCRLTFRWWGCCGLCQRHKPTMLAYSFLFCSCVYFCLYGSFNCFSFHKFSQQLSAFSRCSSGLNSALLVLSATYLFMRVSLSPDIILCG